MDPEKRQRTIYLLRYTDESGCIKQIWYATKRQARIAARELKRTFEIKTARV
jgi:hypothetical protein